VVPVKVGDAVAEDVPLEDASVDAAVASLVLCSVRDARRAVRPGGELRFNEHVVSQRPLGRVLQKRLTRRFGRRFPADVTYRVTRGRR
jgi:SAM-dependent methyltransferase